MNQKGNYKDRRFIARDVADSMGKLPPAALDLEESILGAVLLEKRALTDVIEFLKPDHFYSEAHKTIYHAVIELFNNSDPIDMSSVVQQLRKNGTIELVGGAYYIAELTSKVSSSANIEYHSRVVIEMYMKREVIQIASKLHGDAYDDTTDIFKLLDSAQQSLDSITNGTFRGQVRTGMQVYVDAIKQMQHKTTDGITGVPSGYVKLDQLTSGWQPSDLVIIAARPSMGKTAFVVNCLRNAAVDFKKPAAIFSLEMSSVQLMNRMIASESETELDKVIKRNYAEHDFVRIGQTTNRLSKAPIFIDDTAGLTILEFRAKCRRLKAEQNIQLVIVDYLQLMTGDPEAKNREQEIASISRALKGVAKELQLPVLALSQLSRQTDARAGDKKPMLSDLRESGSIEQDADIVMFLYRPEYYKIKQYEDGSPTQNSMEAIVAKHRNGATDTVKLKFIGKYSKVSSWDDVSLADRSKPLPISIELRDYSQSLSPDDSGDDLPF